MVYNRDSVWLHLYTAYERMVRDAAFEGLDVEEAFARNTDGAACPISRCYRAEDFAAVCQGAGFEPLRGGYLPDESCDRWKRAGWRRSLMDAWAGSTGTSCAR